MLTAAVLDGCGTVRHGFFTREGGVSGGIYASLNCGIGSDDPAANVVENRRRVAAALDHPGEALTTLYQVHGREVVHLDRPFDRLDDRPKADAMVADRPGAVLGILTADCAPVLFADPAAGVIGAAHAGWRGALLGVLEATVAAMEERGAARRRIVAAVGPCIAQRSYEVGPEFPAPFLAADPGNAGYFAPGDRPGHHQFDLDGYVAGRLAAMGLGGHESLARDTYAEEDLFFSYRRSCHRGEPDYGRGLSAIALAA